MNRVKKRVRILPDPSHAQLANCSCESRLKKMIGRRKRKGKRSRKKRKERKEKQRKKKKNKIKRKKKKKKSKFSS